MRVSRSWLERYSEALDGVSERAKAELVRLLGEVDLTRDVATVRNEVIAIMQACCGASTEVAARLAADFYAGVRSRSGIDDGYEPVVDPDYDPAATGEAVRAFVQDLVDGRPAEGFVRKCADRLDYETRRSANMCTYDNAKADPRRPKWARVPMGAETCRFCIMLASRGFDYHSRESASHTHSNCDCRVVPGFDDETVVDGYDPDYYRDVYANPDEHPEVREAINARRRELRALRREEPKDDQAMEGAQL